MPFFGLFRGNPLKHLDLDQLKRKERVLRLKSAEMAKDIDTVEREIQALFQQGKTAGGRAQEISIANSIKTLGKKKEMNVAAHTQIERELAAVNNLIIVGEHEKDLKVAGVWESLGKIPPEKLEKHLIDLQLVRKDRAEVVRTITGMTEDSLKPVEKPEEGLEDILKAMDAVKEGGLSPEIAEANLAAKEKEKMKEV